MGMAIIDVDGVVADVRHRLHHLDGPRKNWTGFFADAHLDTVLAAGAQRVRQLAGQHDIIWLTGRPETLRAVTVRWLAQHDLPAGELLMRPDRSYRPARRLKLDVVRSLARRGPIEVVLDDDPAVVQALTEAGFPAQLTDWADRAASLDTAQESSGRT